MEDVIFWHKHLSNIGDCKIGKGSKVHSHVWIADCVEIGERCSIQAFTFIPAGVRIGNDVFLGPRVTFTNDKYPPSTQWSFTIVEDKVAIGAGAVILPGITLGKGCTIGAGSVVTKNVPPGETWVGNPARKHGD
jgi:UDP-2-acetamido-3-amino-2,3-dideoxy-glucuronate N-acetyltransferase